MSTDLYDSETFGDFTPEVFRIPCPACGGARIIGVVGGTVRCTACGQGWHPAGILGTRFCSQATEVTISPTAAPAFEQLLGALLLTGYVTAADDTLRPDEHRALRIFTPEGEVLRVALVRGAL